MQGRRASSTRQGSRAALIAAIVGTLIVPAIAFAHIERASYWPNPKPDRSVHPPAGGKVPKVRSLTSALDESRPGETRVVCKSSSLALLRKSIARARRNGYDIRPHDHRSLSAKRAAGLLAMNRKLEQLCAYHNIQPAVTASGNQDRVVVMPGLYTEPESRRKPTDDPKCDRYEIQNDRNQSGAVSYKYQFHCPNDQNLIAVLGRKPGRKPPPQPPRMNRHGIPDAGPCIRCNFQIEGSGVSADDVIVDGGRVKSGNHGPIGAKKDVGIRADRADGFVLRNMTVRHVAEHAIYVLEADGYVLDRFKAYYAGEYGVLTFVEDHGVIQNCEAAGSGDSGLYPGAAAETGEQRKPGTKYRYNQVIRRCDSHHNASGYSGTAANAVHVIHNNFYGNALGWQTDVFTAAGHPGFPQDSDLVEQNNFFSNNFNIYAENSDVEPTVPFPVGTGAWIAGGNNDTFRNNRFYDNWRRGMMVFAVPDAVVCGPGTDNTQAGCEQTQFSTSHRNKIHDNIMGVAPGGAVKPNGIDFWWDNFNGNTGNCWYSNIAAPGRSVSMDPDPLPDCDNGRNPGSSVGSGPDVGNEAELIQCLAGFSTVGYDPDACPWFDTPPKPNP
jgi:parallel beta helix pectate lyase-like protein